MPGQRRLAAALVSSLGVRHLRPRGPLPPRPAACKRASSPLARRRAAPFGVRRGRPRRLRCRRRALPAHPPPPATPPSPAPPAAPLGLYGFALTTALLQGAKTQLTEPTGTGQLAISFGFFFGGLAQFCAGLLEYQRRNTFGTVAFCW